MYPLVDCVEQHNVRRPLNFDQHFRSYIILNRKKGIFTWGEVWTS